VPVQILSPLAGEIRVRGKNSTVGASAFGTFLSRIVVTSFQLLYHVRSWNRSFFTFNPYQPIIFELKKVRAFMSVDLYYSRWAE
jgi:hypothetical protein